MPSQTHRQRMSSLRDSRCLTRRDSSPRPSSPRPTARSSSRRRPQLLRACATEPSITTSSAYRGVLATPNSSRRATEILSRVAVSNAAVLSSSPNSTRSFASSDFETAGLTEAEKRELLRSNSSPCRFPTLNSPKGLHADHISLDAACYFSFPNFDAWDEEQQEDGKEVP